MIDVKELRENAQGALDGRHCGHRVTASAMIELLDRLEAAEEKRDALAAQLQGPDGFATWRDAAVDERVRRVAAEKRVQALAAHVERLRGYLVGYSQLLREKATTFAGHSEADIAHRSAYYREAHAVDAAYKAAPENSLARRDALKRAEALEVEADLIEKASPGCGASKRVASVLRERAKYFRHQAGETKP